MLSKCVLLTYAIVYLDVMESEEGAILRGQHCKKGAVLYVYIFYITKKFPFKHQCILIV